MYFNGIVIGVFSFLCIGIFHPIVIKSEYYFSKKIFPLFIIAGIILLILALSEDNIVLSSCFAVAGMSSFWSVKELFEQEKRVKKGWFPKNPNRK